ncbi:hypothetical protein CJU60_17055 [Bacillus sp. 7705b]|nr:hypothetical protein CJU60_17055 [Bacillus sp. 7705b]
MLIESAVELLSYSSSYHLIDTNVTWTSDEIQKVSRIKKGEVDSSLLQRVEKSELCAGAHEFTLRCSSFLDFKGFLSH